ncbi:unnamed protein product [Lampetra planeri]
MSDSERAHTARLTATPATRGLHRRGTRARRTALDAASRAGTHPQMSRAHSTRVNPRQLHVRARDIGSGRAF